MAEAMEQRAIDGSDVADAQPGGIRAHRLGGRLTAILALAAASLLAFEIVFLFGSVSSRYLFNHPLIWSDECATTALAWLAALGAVLAYRRGAHMRMLALVSRLPKPRQIALGDFASAAELSLFLLLFVPAISYAAEEAQVTTQALGISDGWRTAALPTAIALLLLSAVEKVVADRRWPEAIQALLVICVVGGILALAHPLLAASGLTSLLLFFVAGALGLVLLGVPIAFAFGLATAAYLLFMTGAPLSVMVNRVDEATSQFSLLAVPLFIFLGLLMERTGLARALIGLLASLVGHSRNGLSYVLVGSMYLVSGISGSKAADLAAVTPALVPEMVSRGEHKSDLLALLAATAAQTEAVPPSLVLITVGSVTGVSVAALFKGGLLPSLLLAAILCCAIAVGGRKTERSTRARATADYIRRALLTAIPALALPLVIRLAVTSGVATGTEVAAIGIAYTAAAGYALYDRPGWRDIRDMLVETASLSGAILLVIGLSSAMAWALTYSGLSLRMVEIMTNMPGGPYAFLAASVLIFMIFGCLLEGIPAVVLFGPLLFPVARQFHINDVHYAIIAVISMGIGLFAPPFGIGYYLAASISATDPASAMRATWRLMLWLCGGLLLIVSIPWLSTAFL